jgi:hypothetical protein
VGDSFVPFFNANIQKLQVLEFFAVLLRIPRMRELFTKYENKLAISEVAIAGSRPAALERFYLGEIATHLPKAKSLPFLGAFAICCQCLIDAFVNDFVSFKPFLFKELLQFFSSANIPRHFFQLSFHVFAGALPLLIAFFIQSSSALISKKLALPHTLTRYGISTNFKPSFETNSSIRSKSGLPAKAIDWNDFQP